MAEVRVPCPLCGGPIHPIAGRCKHCKGDLAALRVHKPVAAASLPSLAKSVGPIGEPMPPPPEPDAPRPPVHVRPPTNPILLPETPPLKSTWPTAVIIVAAAAIVAGVMVVGWRAMKKRGKPDGYYETAELEEDALEEFGREQERLATEREAARARAQRSNRQSDVRAPVAADLDDYTAHLPRYGTLRAKIDTPYGAITCELLSDRAPMTVANFIGLATGKKPWLDRNGQIQKGRPFYDGLTFHRVIEDFMIQGGDPNGTGTGGPGYQFADEIDRSLTMEAGTLAMANSGKDTNGSQFFITEKATEWLDGKHTIFGRCGDLHVIQRIARVPRSSSDMPHDPVTMTVTITRD